MQLLAVIVPPPEVVRDALEAAQALCSTEPAATEDPGRGFLDRIRGRRKGASATAPVVALHPLSPDAVFVPLAKFGNVTGDDAEGLVHALTTVAGTWPAPVLRMTGVSVAEADPHTAAARLDGDVDALRDIYARNVNEVARQQRFFLDHGAASQQRLALGAIQGEDGAPVPADRRGRRDPSRRSGLDGVPRHARPRILRGVRHDVLGARAGRARAPRRGVQHRHRRLSPRRRVVDPGSAHPSSW